ncbi:hypothetical protein JCM33374_g2966 [Metschnikowia sp. JCM 33374]|nr:hypothetical protein JCM33374_g2966 [Metschnikowia sp. JCM 33374]
MTSSSEAEDKKVQDPVSTQDSVSTQEPVSTQGSPAPGTTSGSFKSNGEILSLFHQANDAPVSGHETVAIDTYTSINPETTIANSTTDKPLDVTGASVDTPSKQTSEIPSNDAPGSSSHEPSEEDLNPVLAAFMAGCQSGDLDVVTELLSSGKVAAHDTFSQGITGLHWAVINNRIAVVKYLVENTYSPADPNRLGGALAASPLHWACRNGLVNIVDYFLCHTSADATRKDSQNYNALHLAVHSSNTSLLVYILLKCVMIDKSIYIDEPDNVHCTALHWAAYQGDNLAVKALLHYGADASKVDKSLMTPLHWAFMRGDKAVLATLFDAGSDIFHKNNKGRDSFGVAAEMNCESTWLQVLKEADRDPDNNWDLNKHPLTEDNAKLITFFAPFVILPVVCYICFFGIGFVIPLVLLSVSIIATSMTLLQKYVIPIYFRKDNAYFQSPFLVGVFSATVIWALLAWVVMLPVIFLRTFFTSIALGFFIVVSGYSFFKTMTINPGKIPVPTDSQVIFDDVKELVSMGKFDPEHFCVNTFIRKPLRSKFSKASNSLVARYDHYCPWVYNDIGVRNHKLFITFVYSLMAAIILFSSVAMKYIDKRSHNNYHSSYFIRVLTKGKDQHHFILNLMIWCWVQGIWISGVCIVQTFQIFKGLTSWEFSSLKKNPSNLKFSHSTLPGDFIGPNGARYQSAHPTPSSRKNAFDDFMKSVGFEQLVMVSKVVSAVFSKKSTNGEGKSGVESFDIPTDFGWKQNWLDFWFIGEIERRNLFCLPIAGENNLNGQVVDYYKLYEYPSKTPGDKAV